MRRCGTDTRSAATLATTTSYVRASAAGLSSCVSGATSPTQTDRKQQHNTTPTCQAHITDTPQWEHRSAMRKEQSPKARPTGDVMSSKQARSKAQAENASRMPASRTIHMQYCISYDEAHAEPRRQTKGAVQYKKEPGAQQPKTPTKNACNCCKQTVLLQVHMQLTMPSAKQLYITLVKLLLLRGNNHCSTSC